METDKIESVYQLPRINDPAPSFDCLTTDGPRTLEDYKGKWFILFSHPADFTPVCTTEFIAFAELYPTLKTMNCELLGLSIDSVYSHIAWLANIEEKMGVRIEYPVIADLDRKVASAYGMIHPNDSGTETSRAVFLVDPDQIIRAIIYYPLSTGRNMDEILRLLTALQTTDKHRLPTPANWKPGDPAISPPPKTLREARERLENKNAQTKDWYFRKQPLPSEELASV